MKKLQLKKNVVARLSKQSLGQVGGGQQQTNGPCTSGIQYCTIPNTGVNCFTTFETTHQVDGSAACDSVHLCNTGGLQTLDTPCQY